MAILFMVLIIEIVVKSEALMCLVFGIGMHTVLSAMPLKAYTMFTSLKQKHV